MKELQNLNKKLFDANKKLIAQNNEFLRSNMELASFNYVASHELQEPLRKIQLFISRIFDDKNLKISKNNAEYLKKAQSSANRMQILIDNLLIYSRVNGTDNIFEEVNLTSVIENVVEEFDLVQKLDNQYIKIKRSKLPVIIGIPFQLKQLFTNLISNSIKFRNLNKICHVHISCITVDGKDIDIPNVDKKKKYYEVLVEDNSIGFEQHYAEKIFILFQRLHDKQKFSGTGIGLAICRKIVENHKGFITAKSIPNDGTIFSIYFPIQ